jgi:universal stress protein A
MTISLQKIICAVDFSAASDFVVRYAAAMHSSSAELIILYVAPEENNDGTFLKKHLHEFSRYSDMLSQNKAHAIFTVQYGAPAAVILDYAKAQNADMILLGSHGNTAIARLLVGSTAETVMRKAFCPVVILKTPANMLTTAE